MRWDALSRRLRWAAAPRRLLDPRAPPWAAAAAWPSPSPSSSSPPASCWSCGLALPPASPPPRFFCPSCRALQPPEPRADLFRLLGWCVAWRALGRAGVSLRAPSSLTLSLSLVRLQRAQLPGGRGPRPAALPEPAAGAAPRLLQPETSGQAGRPPLAHPGGPSQAHGRRATDVLDRHPMAL
ncbi:Hypothetical predicted protein [Podarcis lilfordi]|uniref:HscB tetracysteine metal binding motif domain-containing protein n=1 Tax=Podarcis lilfordi TaxID=74358 RepID=A0AA35PT54_9SAUR|nr:Hypothetical predicted protein [Podarcis lilfordi]